MATTSSVSEANEAGVNLAAMSTDSSSQRSTASSHSSGLPESGEGSYDSFFAVALR